MFRRGINVVLAVLSTLLCSLAMPDESLAQGEVFFREAEAYSVGRYPSSVAVGDFNGDSIADLAVANWESSSICPCPPGSISVLLGNGNGTFQAAQNFVVGVSPRSVTVGDFNGDDVQDLAVANWLSSDVSILLGNGDGTFHRAPNFSVGRGPRSIAVDDFDGDELQDLAVANGTTNDLSILLGNGDGTFREAQNLAVGYRPSAVAVGDFNGDKIPDLAVSATNSAYFDSEVDFDFSIASSPPPGTVFIFTGNGDGTFRRTQSYRVRQVPWAFAVEDFDGDDVQDLAVLNLYSSDVSMLLGNGDGTFRSAGIFRVGFYITSMAIGDFNGDGLWDLVMANNGNTHGTTVSILLGNGDGTFSAAQYFEAGRTPYSVAVGDFNGDGLEDLAVTNMFSHAVSILINETPP